MGLASLDAIGAGPTAEIEDLCPLGEINLAQKQPPGAAPDAVGRAVITASLLDSDALGQRRDAGLRLNGESNIVQKTLRKAMIVHH